MTVTPKNHCPTPTQAWKYQNVFNNIIISNIIGSCGREWQNNMFVLNIDKGGWQRRDKK